MKTNRVPKVIMDSKLDSKIRINRSNTRWITDMEHDLRRTGVKNWRQKAEDRIEWPAVVREFKG